MLVDEPESGAKYWPRDVPGTHWKIQRRCLLLIGRSLTQMKLIVHLSLLHYLHLSDSIGAWKCLFSLFRKLWQNDRPSDWPSNGRTGDGVKVQAIILNANVVIGFLAFLSMPFVWKRLPHQLNIRTSWNYSGVEGTLQLQRVKDQQKMVLQGLTKR